MEVSNAKFLQAALKQLGAPYIWTGKGDYYVTDSGRIMKQFETRMPLVFDCSGLVTWAFLKAGGMDLRGTWNAQRLSDASEGLHIESDGLKPVIGRLRFYGEDASKVTHVSIVVAKEPGYPALVVDASGGDSRTRSIADAQAMDAKVRIHFDHRKDLVSERWLTGLQP